MIRGGIADKLGNRYEAKWVVRCFMDVVVGSSEWLKFEGISPEFHGFEFARKSEGLTEWHQTKINAPHGNWTIRTLEREGLLQAFFYRLKEDKNAKCVFVSQDNAKDLKYLIDKAQIAESKDQFFDIISDKHHENFKLIENSWQDSDKNILSFLSRIEIVVFPERELDSLLHSFGDLYFHKGGEHTFSILRNILEENFNKTLTTDIAREIIKNTCDLTLKDWSIDETVSKRISDETEAYLNSFSPFGLGGRCNSPKSIKNTHKYDT